MLLLRRLWDRLGVGERLDGEASWLGGRFRPSLMVEVWIALLLSGGGCIAPEYAVGAQSAVENSVSR